jgi:hypothetical protein
MVENAPAAEGVLALWEDDELIYVARTAGSSTIRAHLREHLERRNPCSRGATHYSWELSLRPSVREAEIIAEHLERFGALPRCNERAA